MKTHKALDKLQTFGSTFATSSILVTTGLRHHHGGEGDRRRKSPELLTNTDDGESDWKKVHPRNAALGFMLLHHCIHPRDIFYQAGMFFTAVSPASG